MLSKHNFQTIKKIYKKNFFFFKLKKNKIKTFSEIFKSFFGFIDGINTSSLEQIEKKIITHEIKVIFLDGSNLGACAQFIKKKFKNVRIIIYFHNIEAKFFLDSFFVNKSLKSFFIFLVNYLTEKKSIKFADNVILLTKKDSILLKKFYKKPTIFKSQIMPLTLRSKKILFKSRVEKNNKNIIFVGGNFYGNLHGIKWFVKNVLPYINCRVIIVGKGFLSSQFLNNKKIIFIGKVNKLDRWYANSLAVIAPIFFGSGMKTKIAESLMYGKTVFATKFALNGYENVKKYKKIIIECNTSNDFIVEINKFIKKKINYFNSFSRHLFNTHYSSEANYKQFVNFFTKNKFLN